MPDHPAGDRRTRRPVCEWALARRPVLLLPWAALIGALSSVPPRRVWAEAIVQPAAPGPGAFMARAREMKDRALADGDQGYGAVVVKAGRIVGEAPSRVVTAGDPTAHAEMEAIRDAARRWVPATSRAA